jgi:PKD repeat protein
MIPIYLASGIYTVQLIVTNSDGCTDTLIKTDYITIKSTAGIFDFAKNITIKIIPNPTNDKLNISINGLENSTELFIFNIKEQIVYKETLNPSKNFTKQLDVSKYSKGIYYIKLVNDKINYIEKVVID